MRLKRMLWLVLGAVMALNLVVSFAAYAQKPQPKVVRVGRYESAFHRTDKFGRRSGYGYEYQQRIATYMGWKYEYVYGGFGDLYQMLLDGEIDLLAGLAWREERATQIGYPNNIMGHESYYLVKHESDEGITADPSTMNGCRIGVLDSAMVSVLEQYLKDNDGCDELHVRPEQALDGPIVALHRGRLYPPPKKAYLF